MCVCWAKGFSFFPELTCMQYINDIQGQVGVPIVERETSR